MRVQYQNAFDIFATSVDCTSTGTGQDKAQGLGRRRTGIHPLLSAAPHFTLQGSAHMLGGRVHKFMVELEMECKSFFSPGGKYLTELDGF